MKADLTSSRSAAKKEFDVKELAGVSGPLGFFDPLGLSNNKIEEKIRFYREAELKHGRVAMLAAAGFLATESFGPLLTGDPIFALGPNGETETILAPWWP